MGEHILTARMTWKSLHQYVLNVYFLQWQRLSQLFAALQNLSRQLFSRTFYRALTIHSRTFRMFIC